LIFHHRAVLVGVLEAGELDEEPLLSRPALEQEEEDMWKAFAGARVCVCGGHPP
jgi:hypothetical protein